MILERVLFSVDNPEDIHLYSRAVRHLSELEALGKISEVVPCVGSYEGTLEPSFMVLAKDFDERLRGMWFLNGQQTILRVPGDPRQPCVLEDLTTGNRLGVGPIREFSSEKVFLYDNWTYVLETGRYFTTEKS